MGMGVVVMYMDDEKQEIGDHLMALGETVFKGEDVQDQGDVYRLIGKALFEGKLMLVNPKFFADIHQIAEGYVDYEAYPFSVMDWE